LVSENLSEKDHCNRLALSEESGCVSHNLSAEWHILNIKTASAREVPKSQLWTSQKTSTSRPSTRIV
jgi:hypothetical protein